MTEMIILAWSMFSLVIWSLMIGIYLEFGIWSLEFYYRRIPWKREKC